VTCIALGDLIGDLRIDVVTVASVLATQINRCSSW
jgi:hypothetical protein